MAPIAGGAHLPIIIKPNQSVTFKADCNTALVIANKSGESALVDLHVTGDTELSIGYKN